MCNFKINLKKNLLVKIYNYYFKVLISNQTFCNPAKLGYQNPFNFE